jgi:hypothetical protein
MSIRKSVISQSHAEGEEPYRTLVTYYCDTVAEFEEVLREHDTVCVNAKDPKRMLVLDHYPRGRPERGYFCGALDEAKTVQCETAIVLNNAGKQILPEPTR